MRWAWATSWAQCWQLKETHTCKTMGFFSLPMSFKVGLSRGLAACPAQSTAAAKAVISFPPGMPWKIIRGISPAGATPVAGSREASSFWDNSDCWEGSGKLQLSFEEREARWFKKQTISRLLSSVPAKQVSSTGAVSFCSRSVSWDSSSGEISALRSMLVLLTAALPDPGWGSGFRHRAASWRGRPGRHARRQTWQPGLYAAVPCRCGRCPGHGFHTAPLLRRD